MKPTDDVSQFPENGMKTPETKLTVKTTDGAYQPDSSLSFSHANREVLRITHDGHMIMGEGLSIEEATQHAAKMLIQAFEQEIQKMLDARAAAELVTMNVPPPTRFRDGDTLCFGTHLLASFIAASMASLNVSPSVFSSPLMRQTHGPS